MKTNGATISHGRATSRLDGLGSEGRNVRVRRALATNILVPVDFSTESKRAVAYASTLTDRSGGLLTLLHVVKPITCEADFGYGLVTRRSPDQREMRKGKARLKRLALKTSRGGSSPANVLVLSGATTFEITQAAKALGTDLIVMGCHGKDECGCPLGSTAEEVVRQAPCPVFVFRKNECRAETPKRHESHKSTRFISGERKR